MCSLFQRNGSVKIPTFNNRRDTLLRVWSHQYGKPALVVNTDSDGVYATAHQWFKVFQQVLAFIFRAVNMPCRFTFITAIVHFRLASELLTKSRLAFFQGDVLFQPLRFTIRCLVTFNFSLIWLYRLDFKQFLHKAALICFLSHL